VFSGGAQHESLAAVFGKGLTFVGFVMNHGFHDNGDEWVFVVVMLFIDLAGKVGCRHVKSQNDRHVSVRPTCCRHVGQHVGDTTQKAVGRGTGPMCHSMSLADMSAICWQHDKYLAVGFEHMSMLLFLDSPATLPVRTCVLICRVVGTSNMLAA
jgi:hypothetical protein